MNLRALAACGFVAILLAVGLHSTMAADPAASPSPGQLSTDCSTDQLADMMAVYVTEPSASAKPAAKPIDIPPDAKGFLKHILRARLTTCSEELTQINSSEKSEPSAAAACLPSSQPEEEVPNLWAHLKFCESLVRPRSTAPPDIPWQIPAGSGDIDQPVIFVIGLGGDPAMSSKLVSTLSVYLNDGKGETGYHFDQNAVLVPEPTWKPEEFVAQCAASPAVRGAIVVQITATGNGGSDEFVRRRSWTAIEADALYAKCSEKKAAFVWLSDIAKVEHQHITLTPLTPLAAILMVGAAYEVFAPSKTSSKQTTSLFPTSTPYPVTGRKSQTVTTDSTTTNGSGLAGIATGFFSSSITYTNQNAPLTQGPTIDQYTWETLQSIAVELITDMNCWQPVPGGTGPRAVDVIGAPRTLPGYNPPAGLGAYKKAKPSAPFCSEPDGSESINDLLPGTPSPTATMVPPR